MKTIPENKKKTIFHMIRDGHWMSAIVLIDDPNVTLMVDKLVRKRLRNKISEMEFAESLSHIFDEINSMTGLYRNETIDAVGIELLLRDYDYRQGFLESNNLGLIIRFQHLMLSPYLKDIDYGFPLPPFDVGNELNSLVEELKQYLKI
jgi:hypothetical protein